MPIQEERRDSERVPCSFVCLFECTTPTGTDAVTLTEGAGHVINRSEKGMLLLLPENLNSRQVVEIQVPSEVSEVQTTRVVEVRWTRPIEVDAQARMYLAGTRFLFELPVSSQQPQIH